MNTLSFDDLVPPSNGASPQGRTAPPAAPLGFDDLVPSKAVAAPTKPAGRANAVADTLKSLGSGVVRGVAGLATLPADAKHLLDTYATPIEVGAVNAVRSAFGYDPIQGPTPEQMRTDNPIDRLVNGPVDAIRETMDATLHKPETTAGEFAQTIGEFAAPGGIPSRATRAATTAGRQAIGYAGDLARNAVAPGVVSEAAGQLTEGTPLEPVARMAGAVAGGAAGTVAARSAPEDVILRALGRGDPGSIAWQRAIDLQNNSTGVRLSGPEAIAQAENGGTALPDLLRLVEGSAEGRARTAPFFAARQGEVGTAVDNWLSTIAPESAAPSLLGPRAAEAASRAIDDVRQGINRQTRPLYDAAAPVQIPDAEFDAMRADPRFTLALKRLRDNPEIAPGYADLPDNAVGVVDAVTKDMFARGEALASRANPGYAPEIGALNTQGAVGARDAARKASAEYDQALSEQARLRRDALQPLQEGPLGRVAAAGTTEAAGEALLPRNPLVGSEREAADAFARLQRSDPETAAALVRQQLADRYAAAARDTQAGTHEAAGIKFRNAIAGSEPQDAVLQAVLRGLPSQAAADAAPELLDVLQATGRRKAIGSATEFNRAANAELSQPAGVAALAGPTRLAALLARVNDKLKSAELRGNMGTLADLFTDPQSVELIRQAAARAGSGRLSAAAPRIGAQAISAAGSADRI